MRAVFVPGVLVLVALSVCLSMPVSAAEGPDHVLRIGPGAAPEWVGAAGPFVLDENRPGERFTWTFDVAVPYLVLELRLAPDAFDVERPKQIQPRVDVSETHFPLFVPFPNERLWEATSPAQIYHLSQDGDTHILRLGFAGPLVGTFILEKDTTAPVFERGAVQRLDHKGFYQETTTDEPAIGDLLVRPSGTDGAPVRNPTPQFAYLQKFPVQGLDADTEHDVWFTFTDWSDNVATSDVHQVRTLPRPQAEAAVIRPLTPVPNATFVAPDAVVQAQIVAPSAASVSAVRLFVDLQERTDGWTVEEDILRYVPPEPFTTGIHKVAVEVRDAYGNVHYEQWTFWVGMAPPAEQESPVTGVMATAVLVLAGLAFARKRT